MNILFIAPLPPPITGHSLAAKVFLDELAKDHKVEVIDFRKESLKGGMNTFKRIFEIVAVLKNIWRKEKNADIIYFTISQSFAGNIKDLFIYLICFKKLNKMYIHLHGGGIGKLLFDKHKFLFKINKYFVSRLAGVIVLGKSHVKIFEGMLSPEKIHVVPNFAQDYLFLGEDEIIKKFSNTQPLKLLYLSNLISGKGFSELLEAYINLSGDLKNLITIDFAGSFESDAAKSIFMDKISNLKQIKYHGIVEGDKKKEIFKNAHIFCLPTYYPYEGQPISILEAYASGCVVITTNVSGVLDVFTDGVNGFLVEQKVS